MQQFKKIGRKPSWAKHLRKKGSWTKGMANSKTRLFIKRLIRKAVMENRLTDIY